VAVVKECRPGAANESSWNTDTSADPTTEDYGKHYGDYGDFSGILGNYSQALADGSGFS
jgi:hypothetical protein